MFAVSAYPRQAHGETVTDFECSGYSMHTHSSGHFFTVWNEFGSHVGYVERPVKAKGAWHWRATTKGGKLLRECIGPKAAMAAVVEYAETLEGEI